MRTMSEIIGNQNKRDAIRRAIEGERGQTFILEGPAHVGKATAIRALASELLGVEHLERSPDFHEVVPDPELASDALGIWSARQARQFLSLRSAANNFRIVFIEHAERLTPEAQNALLKTLEEPPAKSLLFLIATHSEDLLPTIRSRSLLVPFGLVGKQEVADFLVSLGAGEDKAQKLADLAHGRPGIAKRLYEDEEFRESMKRREHAAEALLDAPMITRLAYSAKAEAKDPDALHELPGQWLLALRDNVRKGEKDASAMTESLFSAMLLLKTSSARPELVFDAMLMGK